MPCGRLEEVFGEPVGQEPPRLVGDREVLLEEVAVVDALVLRVLAEVGGHVLFEAGGGGVLLLLLGRVHLVGGLLEIPTAGDVGAEEVGLLVVEQVLLDGLLNFLRDGLHPAERLKVP